MDEGFDWYDPEQTGALIESQQAELLELREEGVRLRAENERLTLRCERADECIIAFEEVTGGLPSATNMKQRIDDLELDLAELQIGVNRQAREIAAYDSLIEARDTENERLRSESITYDNLKECFGEAIHTAFRKGSDTPEAWTVWKAINVMDAGDWARCLEWAIDTIQQTYARAALEGTGE